MDRRDHLPQLVDTVIVKLRLVERVRAEADLQHGDGRCAVLHDDRRLDADRHQCANRVRGGDDLRDRQVEVHVRLEIDLLHRNAVHGLGLDVLDAVDVRADRVLAVGGDALLHLGRVETGVLPDHRNHRYIDLRKDVGRHLNGCGDPQKQDQRRHHIKGVRIFQRKANDSQAMSPLIPERNSQDRRARLRPDRPGLRKRPA